MTQTAWRPYITVASLIERDERFLMVEESTENGIFFNQPAGHLEDGESLLAAVVRETREETAWHFQPTALVGIYRWRIPDNGRTYLRFCFYGQGISPAQDQPLDTGIIGTRWLNRDELARNSRLRSPLVLTCVDDYLRGQRHSLDLLRELP
jgi:8-oxo-dGTP pyrophosphatase MutT (NUDIX family)